MHRMSSATPARSRRNHVNPPNSLLSPYFGPLSSANPDLDGLDRPQALARIKKQIYLHLRTIAPEYPGQQLPHKRHHTESVPRLTSGTGFSGQLNAGRWYQFVSCVIVLGRVDRGAKFLCYSVKLATVSSFTTLPTALILTSWLGLLS